MSCLNGCNTARRSCKSRLQYKRSKVLNVVEEKAVLYRNKLSAVIKKYDFVTLWSIQLPFPQFQMEVMSGMWTQIEASSSTAMGMSVLDSGIPCQQRSSYRAM